MVLVDIGALDLAHRNEVISQEETIVIANSADLTQALIRVEEQFFPQIFELLRLFGQHVLECFIFVLQQFSLPSYQFILSAFEAPPCHVLCSEQSFFAVY